MTRRHLAIGIEIDVLRILYYGMKRDYEDAREPAPHDPNTIEPLHEVTDQGKLDSMIESLRAGAELPPIYIQPDRKAISGTHRLAAYAAANRPINAITITEEEVERAVEMVGVEEGEGGIQFGWVELVIFITAPKKEKPLAEQQRLR